MYTEHSVFKKPEDINVKVWRYMDFTKFVYLLEKESLFFTRADKFNDPFEGILNDFTTKQFREYYFNELKFGEDSFEDILFYFEKSRQWTKINCWHMNNFESDAMWKLYLKSYEGIAIQSTFDRLCTAFNKTEEPILIGTVQYEDYNSYVIPVGNVYHKYLTKRKSFEHEKEIRAIIDYMPFKDGKIDFSEPLQVGEDIPVDLEVLIEKVYVSPDSPKWIYDLVVSVLKKYGLDRIEVIQSDLNSR
jgi:hypothetical protein